MRLSNHILAAVFVGTVTFTMAWPKTMAFAADPAFQVVAGQRQLFLDDVDIVKIENLTRTMHRPNKKGAVIRPNLSMGINFIQIRMAPIWHPEKKVWQIWDCAAEPADLHSAGYFFSGYYESPDGLHWSPIPVRDIEYRGSKDNNFVSVVMGGKRHRAECIVRDEADPDPNRRYKTFTPNVFNAGRGGYAVSPDGIRWTETSSPPFVSGDEWNITLDEQEHLFLQYLKRGGKYGRSIWLTTSKDFETWTEPELIFESDDLDQELGKQRIEARLADPTVQGHYSVEPDVYNIDVYHMSPFRYESVYLGMPAMYHAMGRNTMNNTDGFHVVELISSRNLKQWTRLGDRKPFIAPSKLGGGAYDLTQIMPPASTVVRGDELWLYYTGLKYRGSAGPDFKGPKRDPDSHNTSGPAAICLAVLRRDGFISLDAGEQAGAIQTEPFKLPGTKLLVNVDAPKGELRVEVLDGEGKVVAQSEPLTGDLLREPVTWAEGNIAKFKGHIASLRFTLRNGQFYSYWLE